MQSISRRPKFLLALLQISILINYSKAQCPNTDLTLKEKYNTYRQKFLSHFICLSPSNSLINGSGLPINSINYFHDGLFGNLNNPSKATDPAYFDANHLGVKKQGDEPEQLALYLGVLSLEYRLFKNEGKDPKGTLNELYYAIQAVNRLDQKAEPFLSFNTQNPPLNGFLMRGDGDIQLTNFFNTAYSNTSDPRDKIKFTETDATEADGTPKLPVGRKDNTFSKDHIIDLLEGFTFVTKFVDDQIIQPTPSDAPIQLHAEIDNIITRIMAWVAPTVRQINFIDLGSVSTPSFHIKNMNIPSYTINITQFTNCPFGPKLNMNWVIYDPINNDVVPRGNNINLLAYPIANIAKNLTGFPWDGIPLKVKLDGSLCSGWDFKILDETYNIGSPSDDLPNAWIKAGQSISDLFDLANNPYKCENLIPIIPLPSNINKKLCLQVQSITTNTAYSDFFQMTLTLATLSKTWSHANVVNIGDSRFFYHYDLMYSLLNNSTAIHTKCYYETLLNSAPCQGPYNYNYDTSVPSGPTTWDPEWHHNNRWVHPMNALNTFNTPANINNANEQGEYHGLDFMLLYNMYRLYFSNQITLPYGNDNSCSCTEQPWFRLNTAAGTLTQNVTVNRKFSTYKNIGIYLNEYVNSNLNTQNKTLSNNTTLVICNNSLVNVDNSGKIENLTTLDPKDSIQLIIRSGALTIKSGGQLFVGANTKVVVEPGAKLEIQSGAKLIINDNAKVIVQLGGQFVLQPNTEIQLKGANSLLDVQDVNTTINLSNNTEQILFTNANGNSQGGTAQFAGGDFSHGPGAKLIIENCKVRFLYTKVNQMRYFYASTADLQLQGDKSVLDLQGDLKIGNGAKFKFTWPGNTKHGYLKFSRPEYWGGNAVPHILLGKLGGCSFELIGNGMGDKMMEVAQETVYMPDNSQFLCTIKNSKIEFTSDNARLQIPCDYVIEFNTFICPNTSSPISTPRGLIVFGQNSKPINNCNFTDFPGGRGIDAELFYGGNKLFLNNCYFNNASVIVQGRGADITQCNFVKEYGPLLLFGSNANSNIKNCSFSTIQSNLKGDLMKYPFSLQRDFEYIPLGGQNAHQNGSTGIYCGTSGAILLNIDNCTINGFEMGVVMEQGVANIKCGEIKNNDFGVLISTNGKVYMSTTSTLNIGSQSVIGGYVDAEDNGITIFSSSGSEVNILNGFNNLKPNVQGNSWTTVTYSTGPGPHNTASYITYTDRPIIYGLFIETPCVNSSSLIPADNNYWKKDHSTSTGQYLVDSVSTVFYGDCSNPSYFSGNRVYFQDPFNTELNKNQFTGCNTTNPCPTCRTTPIANCTNCSSINTSQLGVTASNNAAQTADNNALINTVTANTKALSLYSDVLKSNIRTTGTDEDKYVNKYSHHRLQQAFADVYEQKQIPDSLASQPDFANAIQALDAQITPLNISGDYNNTIFTLLEKGQLYRMARLRQNALTTFNQALSLATTQDHKDYINKWICMTTIEIDALAYPERKGEYSAKLDSCSGRTKNILSSARVGNTNGTNSDKYKNLNEAINKIFELKIYPNPTNGELFIAYKFEEVGLNEFLITDIAGKTIIDLKLPDQHNIIKADCKDLSSGVYFYQLKQNGETVKVDKLIITK